MNITTRLLITLIILLSFITCAEETKTEVSIPPNTEIHLFDLSFTHGQYQLKNGKNITNNSNYDNQPFFTQKSDAILFVSVRDNKQTDIYKYDIKNKTTKQVTNTPQSEYSPKVYDDENISFVNEGDSPYQSVWILNTKTNKKSWLLNSTEPVGYYASNNKTGDILFWSRYGWSVNYLNLKQNSNKFISGNALPSSPQRIPNSKLFSFVHRQTNSEVWIKSLNPESFSITPIAPLFDGNYEYTWAPNGDIFHFKNNQLYIWSKENKNQIWQKGQNLTDYFTGKIARLAISPDGKKIAIVETK